jgi:hypothetical protein
VNIGIELEMPVLVPFQQEWMSDTHPVVCIEGTTSGGKTYVHIPWFVGQAHQPVNHGDEYWWVGPSVAKAKEVFNDIRRSIEAAGAAHEYIINKADRTIETPQGGIMMFKTGETVDLLYGTRNVRLIVVDEFTRCRFGIWTPLKTVIDKTGCPIRFIGNFTGDDTEWHRWIIAMTPLPEFKYYCTTANDVVASGLRSQSWLDNARATIAEPIFNALYLCRGSSDTRLLVSYGAVADIWTNEGVPEGEKAITADIALHGSDRFVAGLWSGWRLKEVVVLEKKTAKEIEEFLKGWATLHGVGRSRIVYDADGLGAYLNSYLDGGCSYQGGRSSIPQEGQAMSYARLRDQCHFITANVINARGLYVEGGACKGDLDRELLATLRKLGQTTTGQWQIVPKDYDAPDPDNPARRISGAKQILGRSPDLSDMVVMRAFLDLTPPPALVDSLHTAAQRHEAYIRRQVPRTPSQRMPYSGR